MRTKHIFHILILLIITSSGAIAEDDKTLSPYFLITSEGQEALEQFPLKATNAEVSIAGVIADIRVTQTYENNGMLPIEATYVFPGSTRAAVYGMKMTIGERVRIAKIQERQQAKATYTKAKKEGKSASLLEQQRPNIFQMSVANIMPGDEIKVELSYTELLVPTDGVYEFSYPTVVGPRFSETKVAEAADTEKWISNPYLNEGEAPTSTFDININLQTGVPIQDLASTTHRVQIDYKDDSRAKVSLKEIDEFGGNRDYILRYRLKGKQIETGMLLYQGEEENFFLMMVQPPERVKEEQIPPREYVFIIDVSGSMHGFPLNISKRLIQDLISNLRSTDTFNVLFFSGGSKILSPESLPATKANIAKAISMLSNQRGGGGTRLLPALQRALDLPYKENTSRTFVIATDGYISVERETFDLIQNNIGNANVFAFGIGSSPNRYLIEGLARVGYGEPFIVTTPLEAGVTATRFRKYIETPVLTGIEIDYVDLDVYDVEPKFIPDVFAERPIVVFGKYKGEFAGKVRVNGYSGNSPFSQSVDLENLNSKESSGALRYLWARHKIASLGDYQKLVGMNDAKEKITKLGLDYNLLTRYTSFVAVDEIVRNTTDELESVKQPLPLPKGVSSLAVGGSVSTVPEPETYLLISLLGIMLLWAFRRRLIQEPA